MACERTVHSYIKGTLELFIHQNKGNNVLRVLPLQESPKAMAQEIAMYGSGLVKEESSGNPGASILGEWQA